MLYNVESRDESQASAAGAKVSRCTIGFEQRLTLAPAALASKEHVSWPGRGRESRYPMSRLVPGEQWRCRRHRERVTVKSCVHGPMRLSFYVMCSGSRAAGMILLVAACLLTQGCVEVLVMRTEHQSTKTPVVSPTPGPYLASARSQGTKSPSAEWLREHWGNPASAKLVSADPPTEAWTYQFGNPCRGIVPWIIIPIPLVLPLQQEKVVFHMQSGQAASVETFTLGWSGGVAGWLFSPDGCRFGTLGGF